MNSFAISIILISTLMHASWNLLARHSRSEHLFFERMQIAVFLLGFIPAIISEYIARSIPPVVWLYLTFSGISCGIYYFSLANSYKVKDFTTVYPVARSLPVLLMGVVDMLRGRTPTVAGWIGMFMVAAGCILSPLESIRVISIGKYINKASFWIFLTAMGTVGYSTCDKLSSELVKPGLATAIRYGFFFYTMSGIFYMIIRRLILPNSAYSRDDEHIANDKLGWLMPMLGGTFNFCAYSLVLWAYQLVERASYVVTFRQFSIVIGAIAAFILYREKGFVVRMTAVFIIALGLVIIALWGK
jgi:uncharacterized membrane protein